MAFAGLSYNFGKKPEEEKESPYSFLNEPKPPSEKNQSPYSFLNEPQPPPPEEGLSPYTFLNKPPVVQNVSATEASKIGSSMMGGMGGLALNPSAPETPATPEELTAIAQSEALRKEQRRSKYGLQNVGGLFAQGALDTGVGSTTEGILTIADDFLQKTRRASAAPELQTLNWKLASLEGKRKAIYNREGPSSPDLAAVDAEIAAHKIDTENYLLSRKAELDKINEDSYLKPARAKVGEFRQAVKDVYPVDPDVAASIPGQTVSALGQVVSQIPLSMTGLGIPSVVSQMFDQTYQEAKQTKGISEEQALAAGYANMPAAIFELTGNVTKLKTLKAAFTRNPTQRAAKDFLEAMAVEGVTEVIQQGYGNKVAKELYDPNREITAGMGAAGIVGALAGGVTSAAGIGAGRIMGSENPKNLAQQDPSTLFPDQTRKVVDMYRKDYATLTPSQKLALDNADLNISLSLRDAIANGTPVDIADLSDYNKDATTPIVLPKDWVQDGDSYVPKGYVAPAVVKTPAVVTPAVVTPAPVEAPLAPKTNAELDLDVEYFDSQLASREMTKAEHKKEMAKIKKQRSLAPVVEEAPVVVATPVAPVVEEAPAMVETPVAPAPAAIDTSVAPAPVVAETPMAPAPAAVAPAPAAMAAPASLAPVAPVTRATRTAIPTPVVPAVVTAPAPAAPTPISPTTVAKKPRRVATTVEDFILPKVLRSAKTYYKQSPLDFTSDLDLALYIVSSKTPSKQRPAYLEWVQKSTGLTEAQAISEGTKIRTEIAERHNDSPSAPILLPVISTRKNLVRQSLTEDPTHLTLSENLPTEQWWARFNVQHARNMGFKPSPEDLKIVIKNAPVVDSRKQELSEIQRAVQTRAEAELEVWKKNNPQAPKIIVVSRPEMTQNGRGVRGQYSVEGGIIINASYALTRGSTISQVASHEWAHALLSSLQGREALQKFAARSIPENQMATLQEKYPRQSAESEIEYNLRIVEEWVAKNAETQPAIWQTIVEAVREFLAKAGLVNLSNEETARAMLRVLRSSNSTLSGRESAVTRQSLADRVALLDSPNFKRWFGSSKTSDENGPTPFYHGTSAGTDFSTFDGDVIFVSPSPEVASYFAQKEYGRYNLGSRVFQLYVRAENPFEFWNPDHLEKIQSLKTEDSYIGFGNTFARTQVSEGSWSALKAIQKEIKAAGFDSYYEMEMGQMNLGVFNPNQLKSAIGNTGEYSTKNDNVSYSLTDEDLGTSIKRPFSEEGRKQLQEYQKTGDLDRARYAENIARDIPPSPRVPIPTKDTLPTTAELKRVMGKRLGNGKINTAARDIPKGTSISVRQDVPSQTEYGVGVVTVRDSSTGRLYYQSFLRFLEPRLRPTRGMENVSLAIGTGKRKISTIVATGKMHPDQSLPKDLDTWTQVGFNPDRHSYMYDRATGTPVVGGSEAIQVGNTVFVKDPVFGKAEEFRYSLTDEEVKDRTQISIPKLTGPVRNRVKTTGQYVGMPPGINTPEKLERLRAKLIRMAQDGREGRYWYEKSSKMILRLTQGNRKDAEVLAAFIAAYSPQNNVYPNLGQAVRAYYEWKAGKKITVGKMGTDIARGQSVADGERWEGIKTNNFYINLMVEIDPEIVQGATVDMWIMRVWGYKQDVPGKVRYAKVEREISLIADRLTKLEADKYAKDLAAYNSNPTGEVPVAPTPWEPQQVQAAIWVAGKARYEEAAALAKKEAKKLGEYVQQAPNAEGKRQWAWVNARNPNVPDAEVATKWGNKIFKAVYQTTPVDISDSKNDFADYVLRDIGQVSLEVRPGSSTGDMPNMGNATPAQQLEYLSAMRNALLDEGGNNVVNRELGILVLGDELLPGIWKDETNLSMQTSVAAPRGSGVEQETLGSGNKVSITTAEQLDSKVAIEAILFKQDGAGWHRPFFVDGDRALVRDANGLALRIGRGMTANELAELRRYAEEAGLKELLDSGSIAIISEPMGVRFINFSGTPNTEFQRMMKSAASSMSRAYDGLEINLGRFASEGNLIENNWRDNPNGETYRQRLAETGRSDILGRIQDLYGPKIRRINFVFAQKYGWDNPTKYAEQLEPAGTPEEEIAQADASDAAFAAEEMGLPEPPVVKGSTPGVLDNQLGPRYSLMDEPISPRFSEVQMAWNKGEMTREEYDQAMAELVKNPEGIEYPASGPALALVETQARTIAGTDIVDLPTVYKSIIEVLQTLGDNAVLRTGRYAGPAAGLYKEFENVIRLRKGMDREGLPIVVHELGHSMAKSIFGTAKSSALRKALRYDPKNLPVVTQLEGLGKKLYGKTRPAIGYTGEGFAEFVRLWMTDDPALKGYDQTRAWFEKTFVTGNPSLGATINSAKQQLTLWRLQGARDRSRAMSSEPKAADKLLFKLRKQSSFATRVEEFAPLEMLSSEYRRRTGIALKANEDPFILASALRGTAGGVLHSWVTLGITDIYGRQVGPSLKEAYALIKPAQEEDFRRYLVALQSQIRLKQGKDPGMSQADADSEVAELSTQYPHFTKAALDISKWWDKALDYQLMAFPEMNYQLTAAIRAANPVYYGPLMRQFTEEEKRNSQISGTSYGIKESKGSARKLENLFLSSLRMAEGIIAKGQRDLVLKTVTDLAKTEGLGYLVDKVSVGKVMKSVNIESIRKQLETYGVDTSMLSDDAMLQYATNADARDAKDPIISIRRSTPTATDPNASTLEWYQVPREIADVLQGVQEVGRLGAAFEIFIGAPNRLAKMGYVSLSAPFQLITNPLRDAFTVFMTGQGNALEIGMGLMKAYGQLAQGALVYVTPKEVRDKYLGGLAESEPSQIAQRLGVSNSTFVGGDIQEAKRLKTFLFNGKVFTTLASPVESLRSALSFTETAPRLSQLESAITKLGWKAGDDLTPEQAIAGMLAYKRATVDFTAHGNESPMLRRGLLGPFYSASIQGTRTLGRALTSSPKKTAAALLTGLTMMTVPALYSWFKYKDEEWWKQLPWREKFLYLNLEVGDNIVQVPLPQDFGAVFVALPIAIMDAMNKDNPEAVNALFGQIFAVGNPVGLPVGLKSAVELTSNRNLFFDRPIVPGNLQKDQPGSQFNKDTGYIAKKLGELFPDTISPIKMEYLVKSVAGSVGLNTLKGPELLAEMLGLNKGVREPDAADTWFYGRLFRKGGKVTANAVSIIEFFDDYQRLSSRKVSEDKALETQTKPLNPLTKKEEMYYYNLEARYEAVTIYMNMARNANRRNAREKLYREAVRVAREGVDKKPKDHLLPW